MLLFNSDDILRGYGGYATWHASLICTVGLGSVCSEVDFFFRLDFFFVINNDMWPSALILEGDATLVLIKCVCGSHQPWGGGHVEARIA
jgi:hypothetical protein